jgi:hypothetical protein
MYYQTMHSISRHSKQNNCATTQLLSSYLSSYSQINTHRNDHLRQPLDFRERTVALPRQGLVLLSSLNFNLILAELFGRGRKGPKTD